MFFAAYKELFMLLALRTSARLRFSAATIFILLVATCTAAAQTSSNEVVSVVRQSCTGYTNCYSSLAAWQQAKGGIAYGSCASGNLVCAKKSAVAMIDGAWSAADVSAVTLSGWTTGATNYIRIYTAPAARHTGTWSAQKYSLTGALTISTGYVQLDGLQLNVAARGSVRALQVSTSVSNSASDVRISNTIVKPSTISGSTNRGISVRGGKVKLWNNIVYNFTGTGTSAIELEISGPTVWAYNNTVYNCNAGYKVTAGTFTAKNNVASACADGFAGTFNTASDYNLSSLAADAPGAHSRNSSPLMLVNPTTGNLHLNPSTDGAAIGTAADLSMDTALSFQTDIDGDARVTSWDMGADQVSQPGVDILPPVISNGTPVETVFDYSTSQVTLTVSTNELSVCKYATTAGTAFAAMPFTFAGTGGTAHSTVVSEFSQGSSYSYYVRCADPVGNANGKDYVLTFSIALPPDTGPPAQIGNLAVTSCTDTTCMLSWTATGDNGTIGTAARYDIRYSTAPIDPSTWAAASPMLNPPVPSLSGTIQSASIAQLTPTTNYYFAIAVYDAAGNSSGMSNVALGATTAPAPGFSFLVYGDAGSYTECANNADHIKLVSMMARETADMVFQLGDMIAGLSPSTNFVQNGSCTTPGSIGSFKTIIAPLQTKPPSGTLPTYFFPTIGNHDDGWGDGWYPDPYGDGICSVFGPTLIRALIPNHFQQPYFKDRSGRVPLFSDADFYSRTCSTAGTTSLYSDFFYYSFTYRNAHFIVLRINNDDYNLMVCNNCRGDYTNYDDYYNMHQLDFLNYDLAKAKADPNVQNIFVFLHAPVFTTADGHLANASWKILSQAFSKYGVKMVFSGHNHVYERTVPIYATSSNPNGVRDDVQGTTYIESGGGGSTLASFKTAAWFDAHRETVKHYLRVNVAGQNVSVTAIDINGNVIDHNP
jgi:hypothetical protein